MITQKDVQKIAQLSKLSLNDEEMKAMEKDLKEILKFVAKLDELNLKDVPITTHAVEVSNVFREDVVEDLDIQSKVIQSAPLSQETFFKVPKVIS